jgi:hypothetical protein
MLSEILRSRLNWYGLLWQLSAGHIQVRSLSLRVLVPWPRHYSSHVSGNIIILPDSIRVLGLVYYIRSVVGFRFSFSDNGSGCQTSMMAMRSLILTKV